MVGVEGESVARKFRALAGRVSGWYIWVRLGSCLSWPGYVKLVGWICDSRVCGRTGGISASTSQVFGFCLVTFWSGQFVLVG